MKLGLGELIGRLQTTNLKLWDVQDWVYQSVKMDAVQFRDSRSAETHEKLRDLAKLNLDRNKLMTAIDEAVAEAFQKPREGKWVLGYSQFGEHDDIDEAIKGLETGYAVEVGCGDGVSCSNTKHLEDRGWQVLCIEANPFFEHELRKNRRNVMMVACGAENVDTAEFSVYETEPGHQEAFSRLKTDRDDPVYADKEPIRTLQVPVKTLDYCVESAGFPRVDVLSIDVEGGEKEVLDGATLSRWAPRVIILEDWKGGTYRDRLEKDGYVFRTRRGVNEVFLRG